MNPLNDPVVSSDSPDVLPPGVQRRALALLVLLVALVVGSAVYVMVARGVFDATHRLVLLADDAEGVTVGMDMTFAGFPIGRVRRIELGADGMARLLVDVPRRDARWLRTSSVFTLERSLVGGTRLRAFSGVLDDPPLPDGAERNLLKGDALAELPQLMVAVREVLGNLNQLTSADAPLARTLGNLATTTERLNGPQGALRVLVGSEAEAARLLAQVQGTLTRTQALLARLDGVAQRTDGVLAQADAQVFGPQGLATDAQHLTRQLADAVAEARQSLKRVDALLADAQQVTGNVKAASTDLHVLRTDVEVSLRKLDSMVNDIQRKWPFASDPEVKLP